VVAAAADVVAVLDVAKEGSSGGGSRNSVGVTSPEGSVMVVGFPRAETAKSSSNSSP
jgi:hypothetical protein